MTLSVDPQTWMVAHFCSVAFMTGLIWIIQVVHYPLMARVGEEHFKAYHAEHSARISWIVIPVMLTELVSAFFLWLKAAERGSVFLALTLVCFGSTALFSVPCHRSLAQGFNRAAHSRLVATNWIRTVAWSVHLGVLVL